MADGSAPVFPSGLPGLSLRRQIDDENQCLAALITPLGPRRPSPSCDGIVSRSPRNGRLGGHTSCIVEVMANKPPLPEWPIRVEVQLAPGWVRIPHDPRLQGRFLRYDPCARAAQRLIRSGQVNKRMLRSTTEFLRRMSLDNLTNLWLGTFIEAPAPEAMLIATMVVMPPVESPVLAHGRGEVDYEELHQRGHDKENRRRVGPCGPTGGALLGSRLSIVVAAAPT